MNQFDEAIEDIVKEIVATGDKYMYSFTNPELCHRAKTDIENLLNKSILFSNEISVDVTVKDMELNISLKPLTDIAKEFLQSTLE